MEEDGRRRVRITEAIYRERLASSQGGEHGSERYDQRMIRDDLAATVRRLADVARRRAARGDALLERPRVAEHGDWSTNVALASAKAAGRNPRELADAAR